MHECKGAGHQMSHKPGSGRVAALEELGAIYRCYDVGSVQQAAQHLLDYGLTTATTLEEAMEDVLAHHKGSFWKVVSVPAPPHTETPLCGMKHRAWHSTLAQKLRNLTSWPFQGRKPEELVRDLRAWIAKVPWYSRVQVSLWL